MYKTRNLPDLALSFQCVLHSELAVKIQLNKHFVRLGRKYFNCFNYGDDQLLCGLNVSGLQSLINTCVNYVNSHGLRFSPLKTTCFTVCNNPFTSIPEWNTSISYTPLNVEKHCKYLRSVLGELTGTAHCETNYESLQDHFKMANKGLG